MNLKRIGALALRYTFLYTRSVPRVAEMFFWPVMDLLVWGFITVYLMRMDNRVPAMVTFLLGSMIFWDILYRAQQAVTISFLEDIWARNLLNIFVAPIRIGEFIAATYVVGFVKILITVAVLASLAWWLYSWNLFQMGFGLIPLFINLLLMGWAVGMVTTALIMRWGQSAEALAWGIPFLIQPVAAVFYPLNVLPKWIQPISLSIPATHVFEGMRQVLNGKGLSAQHLTWAFGLNIIYLIAAALFFRYMFNVAREKGLLAKLGTQ
ncbi:MAG TPA: ABC transporter permease [Verrucomicrobiae bacterium]|nr:ABC transporter permease [Verrucomicrobiae bacterium]